MEHDSLRNARAVLLCHVLAGSLAAGAVGCSVLTGFERFTVADADAVADADGCTPRCGERECGLDGCGGECGTCRPPLFCQRDGFCGLECVPDCEGRECGLDGCGGECGLCEPGFDCDRGGRCVCIPDCEGRGCGPDGCGGECDPCEPGSLCEAGVCRPAEPCEPGAFPGSPCEAGEDCAGDLHCFVIGGTATGLCLERCTDPDDTCSDPLGRPVACVPLPGPDEAFVCALTCLSGDDCACELPCFATSGGGGVCMPASVTD